MAPPLPTPEPHRRSPWKWYRAQRKRTQLGLGCGVLLVAILLCSCVNSIVMAGQAAVTSSISTSSATSTVNTSDTSTQVSIPPTPTPTPTLKPTPTLDPEQRSILEEGQDCSIRSFESDYNADHTQLAVIAASGVIDAQGNPNPWSTKANAVEAGKAIILCLQKYLWAQQPDLQQIGVVVWGQLKEKNRSIVNVLVGGTLTQATAANFDWNQTPDQAWNAYDDKAIK